ncbi:MAG: permease [Betaproteobacteria bacterium RIFCSPLOWO2_12_FULL_64_23]|nr:MAG: permease [Betaproteobacteria bacterium RIFCSPLOWO2_12_FULL_64_23]
MNHLDPRAHRRAIVLMVIAPTLWSIAGVVTRQLEFAERWEVTFWRSLFAAIFVLCAMLATRGRGAWAALRASGGYGLLSGAMWAIMMIAFMLALMTTTTANTLIVNSITPLATALLARAVLRDPIAPRTWAAIALAIAGMLWMFGSGFAAGEPRHLAGMLIALAVPLAAAVNLVTLKHAGRSVDLIPAILLGTILSAVITLPFALPFRASAHDLALLAVLGCLQLGLPCMLMVRASPQLSAPEIALLAMLEVVLGPLWVWLGAGEAPALATLAGGALVIAALLLNELVALRRTARSRN